MTKATILAIALTGLFFTPLHAQESESKGSITTKTERSLPYRGTIGKIDTKKKTFTLKNKSNADVRVFRIDNKTRFERSKVAVKFDDLKPNLQVRGSCIKTGERQYLARLVRWTAPEKAQQTQENSQPATQ